MYGELQAINERPALFSRMTTAALWTDPNISEQMLSFHLDGSVAISSGTTESIDASVSWMRDAFNLADRSRVLDPGLRAGTVCQSPRTGPHRRDGIDFSHS